MEVWGRRSMSEEVCSPSIADIAVNPNVSKELGKGGLRVKAECEQQGPRPAVFLDEIRMHRTNLQEQCHSIVDVSRHRRATRQSHGAAAAQLGSRQ